MIVTFAKHTSEIIAITQVFCFQHFFELEKKRTNDLLIDF